MTNTNRRLLYSIRAKLEAYSQKRGLNKLEALNEALDRAKSVNEAQINLKTAFLVVDNFNKQIMNHSFFTKHRKVS
jgi:hypothetical protein